MTTLIVEDETLAAERLTEMLAEYGSSSIEVVDRLDSIQDVVRFFKSGKSVDLVLLDIQLADGKSFEIFNQINIDVPIIFTTAYDQYALEAFKLHSIDYLLKPIQYEDLVRALEKFKKLSSAGTRLDESDIKALKALLSQSQHTYKQRLLIKSGNILQYKAVDSAAYFFADGKTVYMVEKNDNRKRMLDHTLEELESMLDPKYFFRISRKFIINFDAIMEIKGLISSKLEVKLNQPCEHDLSVSRERAHEFKAWLDR